MEKYELAHSIVKLLAIASFFIVPEIIGGLSSYMNAWIKCAIAIVVAGIIYLVIDVVSRGLSDSAALSPQFSVP